MSKNTTVTDKICLITGATSGIGLDLAKSMQKNGYKVIASGRSEEKFKNVPEDIEVLKLDVTDDESWKQCLDEVKERFGGLDAVVFNAGVCEYIDLPEFKSKSFENVFGANVFGLTKGLEHCLPLLRKSESPHIIGITSSVAWLELPRAEAYGASKAASTYILNSLRTEIKDIDISIVLPGFVKTPMTDRNDFPMPFLIDSEKAARIITKGIKKRKKEIHFPWRFTLILKLLSHLPVGLRCRISGRFSKS